MKPLIDAVMNGENLIGRLIELPDPDQGITYEGTIIEIDRDINRARVQWHDDGSISGINLYNKRIRIS